MRGKRIGAALFALMLVLMQCACGENRVVELADHESIRIEFAEVEVTDAYVEEQIQFMLSLYAERDAEGAQIMPELTDAFVQEHLGDATVEAYRERLKGILYEEAYAAALEEWKTSVLHALIENSVLELDEAAVEALTDGYRAQYKAYGDALALEWEDFCREYFSMSADTFERLLREQAREKIGGELLLEALAEEMHVELEEVQYQAMRDGFMEKYRLDESAMAQQYPEDVLRRMFREELVWERLLEQIGR